MLIIPLTEKISWRNPPIITLGIILLNCLVFFLFQSEDTEKHIESLRILLYLRPGAN